jgi:putative copper export protein
VVAILTVAPQRALRSHRWFLGAGGAGGGALATHGMLSHAYGRGVLAGAADAVHLGAVSLWLGGLFMLAAVVLPRRRREELAEVVPRWSRLAFASMAAAVGAGAVLLVLISPRWTALPTTGYGRFLLLKLVGVAVLLVVAHRAREFARRRLPGLVAAGEVDLVAPLTAPTATCAEELVTSPALVGAGVGGTSSAVPAPALVAAGVAGTTGAVPGPAPVTTLDRERAPAGRGSPVVVEPAALRPFLNAVALELTIAASILATTAILVGRPPPA